MKIEIVNLQKQFGHTLAVNDVSFAFTAGQVVGFVGPNGAGKTTTMRIMATLDEPTSGDVLLNGVSVVEEPERARHLIGYMPDALPTHRDMTVRDYLDFFARAYELKGAKREAVIASVEEFTNLAGLRDKLLNALSKGMKQRVSLARALLHDPPVLIMDEPAAGLDPRARIELRELLRVLASQGKAILISSHILTELAEICDAAVFIEQGRLLHYGAIDQLLSGSSNLTAAAETEPVTRRTVLLRVLGDAAAVERHLLQLPGIEAVRLAGDELSVTLAGDDEACAELLRALVLAGVRLVEFKLQRVNLEEIFLNVTKGVVQ
jgi:ABC-2 type transport system ATP-binding protein